MHLLESSIASTPTIDCCHLELRSFALQLFQLQQSLETKTLDKLDMESDFQIAVLQK